MKMNTPLHSKRLHRAGPALVIVVFLILLTYIYPLIYMVGRSLVRFESASSGSVMKVTLENYRIVFGGAGFSQSVFNSFFVLLFVTAANVFTSVLTGYAFARYRFRGKNLLFLMVLLTLMVPKQTLMVPILDLMVSLGLHDSLWALILPFCVDSFNVFMLRQYIASLPSELEDAVRADGGSEWDILRHVIFPLCKPALAIVIINTSILTWNSFLFPLILTDSASKRTLPVALAMLTQGPHSTNWGVLTAGSAVSSLPLMLVFWIFQREIIDGIVAGALRE